jgi:hypothetical protein
MEPYSFEDNPMATNEIQSLVQTGDYAAIMRMCFGILEERHKGIPGLAYSQIVQLRTYLQSLYNAQPRAVDRDPVNISALGAIAHQMLVDGKTLDAIKDVPTLQLLHDARTLQGHVTTPEAEPVFATGEEREAWQKMSQQLSVLSPNDPTTKAMKKVIDGWARRKRIDAMDNPDAK